MEPLPLGQRCVLMGRELAQHLVGGPFVSTDGLADMHADQVDHYHSAWPKHVHMGRGVVVGVNHHAPAIDAQNRWHEHTLAET